ncbi:MAG: RidA family protein [Burkholderiaceae bacterium]
MRPTRIQVGNGMDVNRSLGIASIPAALANGFIYTYGITAISRIDGKVVPGDIRTQTRTILDNLESILQAAGSDLEHVVSTTVYLRDIENDYAGFNEAYDERFASQPTPRTVVQATMRSPDARVQIQMIAVQARPGTQGEQQ